MLPVFLAGAVLVPMLGVAGLSVAALWDGPAWLALWHDPQTPTAWALSMWTGGGAAVLSGALSAWMLQSLWVLRHRQGTVQRHMALGWGLPVMLATPHAAFAIGLLAWLAPSGWWLRLLSPWLTGWETPPPWPTSQDPWGLGLVLALVLKEIPFLLWCAATQWERDDVSRRWHAEYTVALTLGYTPQRAFWCVIWPQLAPRLRWPWWAVLAYSLTVVDVAWVMGPTAPPTLAVLAWGWLQDGDVTVNAQGAAAGAALMLTLGAMAWAFQGMHRLLLGVFLNTRRLSGCRTGFRGSKKLKSFFRIKNKPVAFIYWKKCSFFKRHFAINSIAILGLLYGMVWMALALGSVMGSWPFPALWPETWSASAWASVYTSASTLWTSVALATAASGLSLLWCVAWLEWAPAQWDARLRPCFMLPLVWPGVLWAVGLYRWALLAHAEGQVLALLLAHTSMVLPYVLLSVSPAYVGFDARAAQVSACLGQGRWVFLWRVKWPLLRRALASAWAVGVAVSMAQYVPTLYVGAGLWATVTTEAVALSAGGQRALACAYAGLQGVLPLLAFGWAAWWGQPRQFLTKGPS